MTGRVQLALNVNDLDESIAFYSKLVGAEPAKVRPVYANFAIADPPLKLILMENPGQGGSLNHLGVEAEQARLAEAGLAAVEERGTTCRYARQDKFWVQGAPDGERWEIYTVLEDSPSFWGQDGSRSRDAAEAALDTGKTGPAPAAQCCGGQEGGIRGARGHRADLARGRRRGRHRPVRPSLSARATPRSRSATSWPRWPRSPWPPATRSPSGRNAATARTCTTG